MRRGIWVYSMSLINNNKIIVIIGERNHNWAWLCNLRWLSMSPTIFCKVFNRHRAQQGDEKGNRCCTWTRGNGDRGL
jgi:hypothetical protein